jgi:poly-gamma-glutamate synthesis protein (capsule biosynthesis protein)
MIFVGDIASPNAFTSNSLDRILSENHHVFSGKRLICNLEGLIQDEIQPKSNEPVLYNHSSVLDILDREQKTVFCLANNHVLDLPGQFESTVSLLKSKDLPYCGAGKSIKEAEQPVVFYEGKSTVFLFNACWDFLLYNHKNPRSGVHVAKLKEESLIERIIEYKKATPDSHVIVYPHWSLDLEILPYPMYRRFSRDLIDAGANVVVGSHSHCIQGGEKYKNGTIIYSLGNFYLPNNIFADNNLAFPDFARIQLAFEWDSHSNEAICHWFEYQNMDEVITLKYLESEKPGESKRLEEYSKFQGMNDSEYLAFFRKNRRKSFLIPVYVDYHKKLRNKLYTSFLKIRANFAHFIAKLHLIKWQS